VSTVTKKPAHRFDPQTLDLDTMLKRLNLANARRNWKSLVERAETEGWSCRDFLVSLVTEEIGQRQQTRLQRAVRDAHFPFLKRIEDFDFSLQTSLRLQLLGSYLGPELVSEGRNLILLGKRGRGKTHLSVAIAYRAIQNGFTALFRTAATLIEELSVATARGKLREALAGYLTYGPDAANVFFHVVNERHLRRRPILFTTNKSPLTAWGDVLHDHDLAEAIVDRVLEKGRLIVLDGPSYRTRYLELDGASGAHHNVAIISGKHRPDFSEPTNVSEGLRMTSPNFRPM